MTPNDTNDTNNTNENNVTTNTDDNKMILMITNDK